MKQIEKEKQSAKKLGYMGEVNGNLRKSMLKNNWYLKEFSLKINVIPIIKLSEGCTETAEKKGAIWPPCL